MGLSLMHFEVPITPHACQPVLLLKYSPFNSQPDPDRAWRPRLMRRSECLQALAPMLTDQLIVTNVARTGFETHMAMPREGNLYTMGMGLVTPVVLGLALSLPHRGVIALDGDGSILLNLGALSTVGNYAPANLIAIIFDNQSYASTGGLPTATAGKTKLVEIAKG